MRKHIALVFFFFTLTTVVFAQKISDEQVLQFVLQANSQGMNQQQMMTQLLAKGVTKDQIMRIKSNYESGKIRRNGRWKTR